MGHDWGNIRLDSGNVHLDSRNVFWKPGVIRLKACVMADVATGGVSIDEATLAASEGDHAFVLGGGAGQVCQFDLVCF